ncbi:hypothetical protein D2V17_15870 [Aurantiacibacter xanthus]|uniref:DUF3828 domain-containing protein n=1 Tax=Aurantiacibacter xanthus TaxID=1784712 RepID=A0A3A1P181_9SPHN|nr:hypothetical protein [Aurantiacibacter xanthus]RIV82256.1 hypothetical protein D2V17_15870 [Aurantiacibacter xanthus]
MIRSVSTLFAGLAFVASAGIPAPLAAQDGAPGIPGWSRSQARDAQRELRSFERFTYEVPGVPAEQARRFRRAASVFTAFRAFPQVSVLAYDHVTRCALTGEVEVGEASGPLHWVRFAEARREADVLAMAADGYVTLRNFAISEPLVDDGNCASDVSSAYGNDADDIRGAEKLAEHMVSMMSGGQIGSDEAPLDVAALRSTVSGLLTANAELAAVDLLAATTTAERTIVIVGDAGGQTRLAAQYRNLADGRWQFERAISLGKGFADYVETTR